METSAERSADNRVAGITITHPEREVFPESQCSKLDVARYYAQMATYILPYVSNRPLSIVRCPRGARKTCFFQKHAEARAIPGVEIASIRDSGGLNPYILANSVEALVGLAQMGTIELHTWMATMPAVERPDTFIIDFDPDTGVAWSDVVKAARTARALLDDLGLVSFVKTTGGKGLHVVVPLARRHSWEDIKSFSRDLAMRLVQNEPDRYVAVASKAERKGKIFVDYLRNSRGATAVVPYSLRARAGATVATPIAWDTLTASLEPASLTLSAVLALVQTRPDPWADYLAVRQTITAKMKRALAAHS
jgi:bifunctional non-homologous end joining protein LigD